MTRLVYEQTGFKTSVLRAIKYKIYFNLSSLCLIWISASSDLYSTIYSVLLLKEQDLLYSLPSECLLRFQFSCTTDKFLNVSKWEQNAFISLKKHKLVFIEIKPQILLRKKRCIIQSQHLQSTLNCLRRFSWVFNSYLQVMIQISVYIILYAFFIF